jgi:hypothetical protein
VVGIYVEKDKSFSLDLVKRVDPTSVEYRAYRDKAVDAMPRPVQDNPTTAK